MMHSEIVIAFIVIGLPVICGTLIILSLIGRGRSRKHSGIEQEEQQEIMEDLYEGMKGLEKRIENLEIIFRENKR